MLGQALSTSNTMGPTVHCASNASGRLNRSVADLTLVKSQRSPFVILSEAKNPSGGLPAMAALDSSLRSE
jgi:hypothetical protein